VTWFAPSALIVGGVGLLVLVAAHLISRRPQRAEWLPTARFVPERGARVAAQGAGLSDLGLLLLRAIVVVALAAAFAGPLAAPSPGSVAHVVAVDMSADVGDPAEARDSARAVMRAGDLMTVFDTASRAVTRSALDSMHRSMARGSLSAALAGAAREGSRLGAGGNDHSAGRGSDSVELVLVSPFSNDEMDDATLAIRSAWPGRVRIIPVSPRAVDTTARPVEALGAVDDPVIAAVATSGFRTRGFAARVVRRTPTAADSAWASEAQRLLVHWPARGTATSWPSRPNVDTSGAVIVGDAVLVANLPRRWVLAGAVAARWVDGEPAAVDRPFNRGCIRDVGLTVDDVGDITLRRDFHRVLANLITGGGCGGPTDSRSVSASVRRSLEGAGPLASARSLRSPRIGADRRATWAAPLLALALVLLLVEPLLRRNTGRAQ
jgi:hypothetical protein